MPVQYFKRSICSTLTILALALPTAALAFSNFDNTQDLDIDSNTWNQVLFYNYDTGQTTLSSVGLGDRELDDEFRVNDNQFSAAFLYDYTEFEFTAGFYATKNVF